MILSASSLLSDDPGAAATASWRFAMIMMDILVAGTMARSRSSSHGLPSVGGHFWPRDVNFSGISRFFIFMPSNDDTLAVLAAAEAHGGGLIA